MNSVKPTLFTDPAHLNALKAESREGSEENLREVARQFESLFTHMIMKNMRAANLGDGVFDSDQSKFYQDMFDQQMSTELTRGKGLGIAELLVQQLGGGDTIKPTSEFPVPVRVASVAPNKAEKENSPAGPAEFIKQALPHARRIGEALGIAPRLILAQAALETGWGSEPIENNVFGIKTGSNWNGASKAVKTLEFASGIGRQVSAAFRAYSSMAESFDDYAKLLSNSSRYKNVLNTGEDEAAFAGALKQGGYATDPDYVNKIMDIAGGKTLSDAMSVAEQSEIP